MWERDFQCSHCTLKGRLNVLQVFYCFFSLKDWCDSLSLALFQGWHTHAHIHTHKHGPGPPRSTQAGKRGPHGAEAQARREGETRWGTGRPLHSTTSQVPRPPPKRVVITADRHSPTRNTARMTLLCRSCLPLPMLCYRRL